MNGFYIVSLYGGWLSFNAKIILSILIFHTIRLNYCNKAYRTLTPLQECHLINIIIEHLPLITDYPAKRSHSSTSVIETPTGCPTGH